MNQTPVVTCADGGEGHGGEGVPEARLQSVFDHLGDFDQVRLSDQMKDLFTLQVPRLRQDYSVVLLSG